ncbi:MAG: hypothetical protein Q7S40_15450 [Opitutaceae bacterium]|nr:hypothetical protein [Opitutaceae bacterium]
MSALASYPILTEVLECVRSHRFSEPETTKTNRAGWEAELAALSLDSGAINEILREHLAEPKEEFWSWLEKLTLCGGFVKPLKHFARQLTERFLTGLEPAQRQMLLGAVNNRKASYFFNAGRWLTADTVARNFPVGFFATWIESRFVAYGNDGAVGDLWRLLQKISDERPEYAFALACEPTLASPTDGRKFQIELLGGLRFRSDLPSSIDVQLRIVLEAMRISSDSTERAHYWRTMKRSLTRGRLPDQELELALAATAVSPEEYDVGFELAVSGSPETTPKAQTIRLLKWLDAQFAQPRGPMHQYNAATTVWLTVEHILPDELGFEPENLLLKLQPIDPTHLGIWRQIDSAIYPLAHKFHDRFLRFLRLLARDHWTAMRKVIEHSAPLYGAIVRLSERREEVATFAANLIASTSPGERRFGFHLIEELQLPGPSDPGAPFTPEEFTIWLAEFRLNIAYKTVAQQLLNAAARLDLTNSDMVSALQEEVLYQCKSLPGLCLDQLRPKTAEFAIFTKPIEEADAYFAALTQLNASPIKAQRIPGLLRAIRRKRVRDQVKMDEEVAAHSIFEQFAKKSYLLYGSRWSTFNGGVLSQAGPLQTTTVATEFPRKAFIDPEGYLGMKYGASGVLSRLQSRGETEE